ncbi:hypothetical protein ACIQGO_20230 [Streptomyces shenzhenensis]|uniref:hypothetical protein n=1 Tax=Streptomyces shenzhenensis TaxID=943815 RepID=UPI00382F4814
MRYRNRTVFAAAVVGIVAQPCAVLYVLLTGTGSDDRLVDAAALLSLASLVAWLFARIGVQPSVSCGDGVVTVHNPLLSYRAPLTDVQFVARNGAVGLRMEGVGTLRPWVLSKSVFDGGRARSARGELRDAISRAHAARARDATPGDPGTGDPDSGARRWVRWGATDLLLLPPLAFAVWNVVDVLTGG